MTDLNKVIQSQAIDALRFPLAVAVVFIHSGLSNSIGWDCHNDILSNLLVFVINSILPAAVPLFFLISGFLFFLKMERMSKTWYLIQMKKKCRTLLLPYMCWNILAIPIFIFCVHDKNIFSIFENVKIGDFFLLFWAYNGPYPLDLPLWFVRDLFILMLLSPIIYCALRKCKYLFLIIIALPYLFVEKQLCGLSYTGLLYFSIGAFFSLNKDKQLFNIGRNLKRMIMQIFVGAIIIRCFYYDVFWIQRFYALMLTFVIYQVFYVCVQNRWVKAVPLLSKSSFFIFAAHYLCVYGYSTALLRKIIPSSGLLFLSGEMKIMLSVALCCSICFALYLFLYKSFPKLAGLLTGGRM